MRMVPFVTFECAPGEVLPEPLQEMDMVIARPVKQAGRVLLPFQFVARVVTLEQRNQMESMMESDMYGFHTKYHDPITGRWEAEGAFDMDEAQTPGMQLIPDIMEHCDLPWLHIRGGQLHIRLVPFTDLDALPIQSKVEKFLKIGGAGRKVILSYQDYREYQRWKERLAPPDQVRPRSLF